MHRSLTAQLPLSRYRIDRDHLTRERPRLFEELAEDPRTRVIALWRGEVLIAEDDEAPSQWFTRSEKAVFWLDATQRGEGLNLMDFCSREYGMAFGTEMGMYGTFEGRVKLGMLTVQTAVSVFEERWR